MMLYTSRDIPFGRFAMGFFEIVVGGCWEEASLLEIGIGRMARKSDALMPAMILKVKVQNRVE